MYHGYYWFLINKYQVAPAQTRALLLFSETCHAELHRRHISLQAARTSKLNLPREYREVSFDFIDPANLKRTICFLLS